MAAVAVHLPYSVSRGDAAAGIPQFVNQRVYDFKFQQLESVRASSRSVSRRRLADDVSPLPMESPAEFVPLEAEPSSRTLLQANVAQAEDGEKSEKSGPVMIACEYESTHWSPDQLIVCKTGPVQVIPCLHQDIFIYFIFLL